MRYKPATDYKLARKMLLGFRYALLVVWEVIKANIVVLRIVFSRKINVEPQIISFRTALKSNVSLVALAISFNLIPGTVTVTLEDGLFCLHCLDRKFAQELKGSVLIGRLLEFEE
jgi:multicomponent Na+:H+ antiporter subunit E